MHLCEKQHLMRHWRFFFCVISIIIFFRLFIFKMIFLFTFVSRSLLRSCGRKLKSIRSSDICVTSHCTSFMLLNHRQPVSKKLLTSLSAFAMCSRFLRCSKSLSDRSAQRTVNSTKTSPRRLERRWANLKRWKIPRWVFLRVFCGWFDLIWGDLALIFLGIKQFMHKPPPLIEKTDVKVS